MRNEYYGVFFDIRNFAYVCPAPTEEDLNGAYLVTRDKLTAQKTALDLNTRRRNKLAIA